MDPQALIDHYVKAVSKLADRSDSAPIHHLIDAFSAKCSDTPYRILLEGERAFWKEDFEAALKKYLKAKSLPNVKFFCYRASAYISDQLGDRDQAVDYAKKALTYYPNDPSSKSLMDRLATPAEELQQILKDYPQSAELFHEEEPNEVPPPSKETESCASTLSQRIHESRRHYEESLQRYLEFLKERNIPSEDFFSVLNGWDESGDRYPLRSTPAPTGIFCRMNQYGIVINPGRHFLDRFHDAGFLVTDIDAVIVTQECLHCTEDLLPLHHLNNQLNEHIPKRHVIQYYLHPAIHRELSPFLKSRYKEDKHAVHSLELFENSSQIEKTPLFAEVSLGYFVSTPHNSLGITLETPGIKLGYISGCSWSPMLPLHLKGCDLLCVGVGHTSEEDLSEAKPPHDCLGYTGTRMLLESINPKLLLCTEFSKHVGDQRLEFVHELRLSHPSSTIFPADLGFYCDLRKSRIRCSVSEKLVDLQSIKVTRTQGSFSKLYYQSEHAVL